MTQYVIVLVGRKVPPVFEVCGVNHVLGMDLFEGGAQGRSLPHILCSATPVHPAQWNRTRIGGLSLATEMKLIQSEVLGSFHSEATRVVIPRGGHFDGAEPFIRWCPGAVAPAHPCAPRHRCMAQASFSTGSRSHLLPAQWSLPHIHVLRDTGASLHNGIEPPTRGFSVRCSTD